MPDALNKPSQTNRSCPAGKDPGCVGRWRLQRPERWGRKANPKLVQVRIPAKVLGSELFASPYPHPTPEDKRGEGPGLGLEEHSEAGEGRFQFAQKLGGSREMPTHWRRVPGDGERLASGFRGEERVSK